MDKDYITRLHGEKTLLEENLKNEGFRDGVAYAQTAHYRALKLIDKAVEAVEDRGVTEVTANLLACTACEAKVPDGNTLNWMATNLSYPWQEDEEYLCGFVDGVRKILSEVDSAKSKQD